MPLKHLIVTANLDHIEMTIEDGLAVLIISPRHGGEDSTFGLRLNYDDTCDLLRLLEIASEDLEHTEFQKRQQDNDNDIDDLSY